MDTQTSKTTAARANRTAVAALSIGAIVLSVLITVQGAGLFDRTARAEMSIKTGGYTSMTTNAQTRELLYVVDDRNEVLMLYETSQSPAGVVLLAKESLPTLFSAARGTSSSAPGRGRGRP